MGVSCFRNLPAFYWPEESALNSVSHAMYELSHRDTCSTWALS
jgi:hypothetical protein